MKRALFALPSVLLASIILIFSVFKIAQPTFGFDPEPTPGFIEPTHDIIVDYPFPQLDAIDPSSPVWFVQAAADKARVITSFSSLSKASVFLELANKRLVASKELFRNGEAETGLTVLTKAEKYLESALIEIQNAQKEGDDTAKMSETLKNAALAHSQMIQGLVDICPEQAKPMVIAAGDYPKRVVNETISLLSQ